MEKKRNPIVKVASPSVCVVGRVRKELEEKMSEVTVPLGPTRNIYTHHTLG